MNKAFGFLILPLSILIGTPVLAAPPKIEDIGAIISNGFDLVLPIGVVIGVVFGIIGGYMWMTAGGDPGKTQQAQGTLTWAVLGVIFLFLIKMVLTLVLNEILS